MRLHFQEYGEGRPLIILHGLFGSLGNWHSISRRLAARHRVLAVDQRNHGRSPHSPEMNYGAMAGDLAELLNQRGLRRSAVLGHSMGGKTGMQFALSYPERTAKLIVVDIAPRPYKPVHLEIFHALRSLDLGSFSTRQDLETALAGSIPDLRVRRFLLKNAVQDVQGGWCWRMDLEALFHNYPRLNAEVDGGSSFDRPALFIRGGNSDYIHEPDCESIHRLFPQARFCTIPEAGHWVHADAPNLFVDRVEDFLGH